MIAVNASVYVLAVISDSRQVCIWSLVSGVEPGLAVGSQEAVFEGLDADLEERGVREQALHVVCETELAGHFDLTFQLAERANRHTEESGPWRSLVRHPQRCWNSQKSQLAAFG